MNRRADHRDDLGWRLVRLSDFNSQIAGYDIRFSYSS